MRVSLWVPQDLRDPDGRSSRQGEETRIGFQALSEECNPRSRIHSYQRCQTTYKHTHIHTYIQTGWTSNIKESIPINTNIHIKIMINSNNYKQRNGGIFSLIIIEYFCNFKSFWILMNSFLNHKVVFSSYCQIWVCLILKLFTFDLSII